MDYIGTQLKELRISKGLTIEDIQDITKIRTRYLQAIEEGNLDKLPGKFYERAFIKSYAEVVNLDSEILNQYFESLSGEKTENVQIIDNYYSKENFFSKLVKWFSKSLVYILIILVIFIIYIFVVFFSNNGDNPQDDIIGNTRPDYQNENENTKPDEQSPENQEEELPEEIIIVKTETTTYGDRVLEKYVITYTQGMELEMNIKASGPCWISIKEEGPNGKELFMKTIKQGEETGVFKLDKSMWLNIGNTPTASIHINDEIINVGDGPTVKYVLLELKAKE